MIYLYRENNKIRKSGQMYNIQSGIYAIIIAFGLSAILGPIFIPMFRRLKFGQNVRDFGPESHLKKQGTPSMGGVIFLLASAITLLFFMDNNEDGMALLLFTLGFGVIGFIDDYLKVKKKSSDGLMPMQKIVLQSIVMIAFLIYLVKTKENYSVVYIPFMDNVAITLDLWVFVPFYFLAVLGTVNAVNLTDGLDGLASGVTLMVATFFGFVALLSGNNVFIYAWALSGALVGFLLFNSNPAKVFMGDTGSLALGGFVVGIAFILNQPLLIVIVGFIYVLEVVSVCIQVPYYKYTKKKYGEGRRIFKMTPFHHHLEESGYKETKIVAIFYIITAILCLVGFLSISNIYS